MQAECAMAIEILEKTHDGYDLYQTKASVERLGRNGEGWQLALVQSAVNDWLTANGKLLFAALHRQVCAGDYCYPLNQFMRRFCPELS